MRAGVAAEKSGDFQAAVQNFRNALSIQPNLLVAHVHLAAAYYKANDLFHARMEAEQLHTANPADLPTALLLANTYIKMGREAQAAELLAGLEAGHETDMELEYSLAFAQIQSGRDAEGLPRMEKVARAMTSANAWFIAGAGRFQQSEFVDAKADLDAALKLNASLPGLQSMAGQVDYALGDGEAANPHFQAALRADPRDFNANLYTGMYLVKQGDFESARPLLELAVQLQPASPLARLKLAELNGITGNYTEAVGALEGLEKAAPDWPEPHIHLAALYYKLHRPEDGQRERAIVEQILARQQMARPANK
jgi:tetratricopeptide (TPR) repeat protein